MVQAREFNGSSSFKISMKLSGAEISAWRVRLYSNECVIRWEHARNAMFSLWLSHQNLYHLFPPALPNCLTRETPAMELPKSTAFSSGAGTQQTGQIGVSID